MNYEERMKLNYSLILNEIRSGGIWQRITLFEGVTNAPHLYVVRRKDYTGYAWMDPDKTQGEWLWPFCPYIEQIAGIVFLRRAKLLRCLKDELRWEELRMKEDLHLGPNGKERIKRLRDNIKELNELLSFIQKQAKHRYHEISPV